MFPFEVLGNVLFISFLVTGHINVPHLDEQAELEVSLPALQVSEDPWNAGCPDETVCGSACSVRCRLHLGCRGGDGAIISEVILQRDLWNN